MKRSQKNADTSNKTQVLLTEIAFRTNDSLNIAQIESRTSYFASSETK